MQYYIVIVENDINPRLEGPFDLEDKRDLAAKRHKLKAGNKDGIYALDIDHIGDPSVWPYPEKFMQDDEEE